MYDNWINNLSESYIKTRLGINEEEDHMVIRKPKHPWKPDPDSKPPDLSKFHPKVVTAVQHLNQIMSQHGDQGPYDMDPHINLSNFLVRTSRGLPENPTNSQVTDAAVEAARDHHGWGINRELDSNGTYRTGTFTDEHLEQLLKDKVDYHLDQHHPEEPKPNPEEPKPTNESTNLFEQLNDAKEYAYILEHVLNTLLEHEIINEEIIMEVLNPHEVGAFQGAAAANARGKRLHNILKTLERLQKEPLNPGQDPFGLEARIRSNKIARASEIIDGAYEPNLSDRIDSGTVNPSSIEKIMRTKAKQGMLPAPHWSSIEHAKNMARTPYKNRAERKKMHRQDNADYKKQQGN